MRLVLGHEQHLGPWAEARIPHLFLDTIGPFVSFGVLDDEGHVRGVALYHGYAPRYRTIEISFVLDVRKGLRTWLTAPVIAGIMSYPFKQLGCVRVTAATPGKKSAASARRFLETFGFKREGLARLGFGDFGDAVIYGLTARDWSESRFNPERRLNGQEIRPHSAACA